MEGADFGGYATKAGLKCSDGRVITPEAFAHMNGQKVPLVWQHSHKQVEQVLGHVMLEARGDGMYAYGFFNNTEPGKTAKELVLHGDVTNLSIWANQLVEKMVAGAKQVLHGAIREVSLVLSGANPGAKIDFIQIAHGDGYNEDLPDEAIIHTGLAIDLLPGTKQDDDEVVEHQSLQQIYDDMTPEQKDVVHYMLSEVLQQQADGSAKHSDEDEKSENTDEDNLEHKEGVAEMTRNAFENTGVKDPKYVISHADVEGIFAAFKKDGSFKEALHGFLDSRGLSHGIDDIQLLFPDAKALTDRPEWDTRRMEWVSTVLNGTKKTPFSRIKTLVANLTLAAARAKGYVKGSMKKEEFFGVSKRTTGPTTVYKKQKLDRDDIVDIQDFDVVAWLWGEIRMMLEEEIARAILLGDGRDVDDEDKIADPAGANSGDGIRSIYNDHDYYAQTINVNLDDASSSYTEFVDAVISTRRYYKGSGLPTFFTTEIVIAKLLTIRSALTGERLYRNLADLAAEMRVSAIIPVEPMEEYTNLLGILVNLSDYNVGTNRGGEITNFDQFDIDYNQYKYLMETRLSGALTKVKSALIYKKVAGTDVLVVPNAPTFVEDTGVVTIVATTGIVYKNKDTGATLSTGAQSALAAGASITVVATSASGYYQADNINDEWTFTRPAA
jgi:HK97 family phage prohead protease